MLVQKGVGTDRVSASTTRNTNEQERCGCVVDIEGGDKGVESELRNRKLKREKFLAGEGQWYSKSGEESQIFAVFLQF